MSRRGFEIRAERAKQSAKPASQPATKPKRIVSSYAKSRRRWIDADRPVREQDAVEAILDNLCKPCEYYRRQTENTGRCGLCSCQLNLGKKLNKIYWATEGCPDDPPKWTADVKEEDVAEYRKKIREQQREEIRNRLLAKRKKKRDG